MMHKSDKLKVRKGLVEMNRLSFLAIVLFLVVSMTYYLDMDPRPMGTIILIQGMTLFFAVGGVAGILSGGSNRLSDGIDISGSG